MESFILSGLISTSTTGWLARKELGLIFSKLFARRRNQRMKRKMMDIRPIPRMVDPPLHLTRHMVVPPLPARLLRKSVTCAKVLDIVLAIYVMVRDVVVMLDAEDLGKPMQSVPLVPVQEENKATFDLHNKILIF